MFVSRSFALMSAALLLAGCLDGDFGQPIDREVQTDAQLADQIVVGRSTQADVVALLGQPGFRQQSAGGEVWGYTYDTRLTNAAMYIPVVQMVAGRAGQQSEVVTISFNRAGVVRDVRTNCSRVEGMILSETQVSDC